MRVDITCTTFHTLSFILFSVILSRHLLILRLTFITQFRTSLLATSLIPFLFFIHHGPLFHASLSNPPIIHSSLHSFIHHCLLVFHTISFFPFRFFIYHCLLVHSYILLFHHPILTLSFIPIHFVIHHCSPLFHSFLSTLPFIIVHHSFIQHCPVSTPLFTFIHPFPLFFN
jgi:hypothetical protein